MTTVAQLAARLANLPQDAAVVLVIDSYDGEGQSACSGDVNVELQPDSNEVLICGGED